MSEPRFEETQAYFAAVAQSYDRLQPVVAGPAYEAGLKFMIKLIPHEPEEAFTCVELGCGTATLTESVLQQFPEVTCIAIDNEPAMLDIARRKLAAYDRRAEVRAAEATTADMPPCDVVLTSFMLHHVPPDQFGALFGRVRDVLRGGGCLIVLDTMQSGPRWGERVGGISGRLYRRHVQAAIASGQVTQAEVDARWELKRKMKEEGRDTEYRHTAEDIIAAMDKSGFGEIGLVWRQFAYIVLLAFQVP